MRGGRCVGVIATLITLLAVVSRVGCLRCYQCGTLQDGMSTVNPCFGIKPEDNQECPPSHNHCKRYSNEGIIVLACAEECKESHSRNTDITCCSTDGCNTGWTAAPSALLLALAALMPPLSAATLASTH